MNVRVHAIKFSERQGILHFLQISSYVQGTTWGRLNWGRNEWKSIKINQRAKN